MMRWVVVHRLAYSMPSSRLSASPQLNRQSIRYTTCAVSTVFMYGKEMVSVSVGEQRMETSGVDF